jgi:D-beta-D-heptose 7-phosphate kinase/D-beta-D-heptose 1-phosphate adenosyltransferase
MQKSAQTSQRIKELWQTTEIHVPDFQKARVLVVGDILLDRYWFGSANRISPEAPVPVVQVESLEERPGGAGNVAMNLKALGAHVALLGVTGADEAAQILNRKLEEAGILTFLQAVPQHPTITKIRVLSHHQQLIRLDFEESFYQFDFKALLQKYESLLSEYNAVIISDYHKGTIQDPQALICAAKKQGVAVLVDPKSKDFSIYRNADVLTPNRKEFEQAVAHCNSNEDFETHGLELVSHLNLGALLVTRSSEGMSLIRSNSAALHLPARAYEVRDVTGAGDTVISILAAAIAAGDDMMNAMKLANIAAGIVVTKLGAATVSEPELRREVHKHYAKLGVLTIEEAIRVRNDARKNGERIVMTNGCFDILHPGHIGYLEAAKALGDRLIVAINSDESAKRLKGKNRPIQSLSERMTVLSGLRAVDWVVPFSEDTPENIIEKIIPDILVKGVDYENAVVVGSDCVIANGGEVKLVGPPKQWSTTEIIESLKKENLI